MAKKCVNINAPEFKKLHQQLNVDVTSSAISSQLVAVNIALWQDQNDTEDFPTLPELKDIMKVSKSERVQREITSITFSPIERKQRVRFLANRFSEVVTALYNRDREDIREQMSVASPEERESLLHTLNLMNRNTLIINKYGVKQIWNLVKSNFIDRPLGDNLISEIQKVEIQKIEKHFSALITEASSILKLTEGIDITVDAGIVKISDSYQSNEDQLDQINDFLENEEHSSKEDFDIKSEKISSLDTTSPLVKSILSSIPRVGIEGQEVVDDLGTPEYIDMDIAHGVLMEILQPMEIVEDMIPILESKVEEFSWLRGIVNTLNRSKNIKNLFYSAFNKAFIQYNYIDSASNISKPLNTNLRLQPIVEKFIDNLDSGIILSKDSIYTSDNKIDSDKVTNLKNEIVTVQTLYKKTANRKVALTEELKSIIGNSLHAIGINYSPSSLNSILEGFTKTTTKDAKDPINIILGNIAQILNGLENNSIKFSTELVSSYKGKYNAIARLFFLEDGSIESSFRHGSDSYYSYMLPSYISKLEKGIKGSKSLEYIQKKFKGYSFFYDKLGADNQGKWKNALLERLERDPEARNNFKIHTVLSDRNKKPYMQWNYLDSIITRMTEFGSFSLEKGNYANFMVPVMSDAPKCFFMTLPKMISGISSIKEQSIDRLVDTVFQEYTRIKLVRDRKRRMDAGENITAVTNFDIDASKDGIGGNQFKSLPALNTYRVPMANSQSISFIDRLDQLMSGKEFGEDVDDILLEDIRTALLTITEIDFNQFIKKLSLEGAFIADEKGNYLFPNTNKTSTGLSTLKTTLSAVRKDLLRTNPEIWKAEYDAFLSNMDNYSFNRINNSVIQLKKELVAENLGIVANRIIYKNNLLNRLEDYYYNDIVATSDIYQLLTTDLAFYPSLTDLSKRFKQSQGATQQIGWEAGTQQRVVIMKDSDVPAGGLNQIESIYNDAVNRGELSIERKGQLMDKLSSITETDGQAIISLDYYKKIMEASSNWNPELERVYKKMLSPNTQNWTINDYGVLFQIIKPFTYTQRAFQDPQSDNVIPIPFQNKNSIFVLTPQYAKGKPKLEAALQYMKKYNVEIIQFESAVKVGIQGSLNLDGDTTAEILTNLDAQTIGKEHQVIFNIDASDFGIQVSTVPHFLDTETLIGSQLRKILVKDIPLNTSFNIKGMTLDKSQLLKTINDLQLANQAEGLTAVETIFNTESNLSKEVTSELLKDGRFGPDAITAVSMASDGKLVLPLFTPSRINKVAAKVLSIIKTKVSKQTIAGGAFIQATSLGIRYETSYNGQTLDVKFSEDGKTLEYIECLVPAWSKELFEPLIDPKTGLLDINKKNLDGSYILPLEARRMIVNRIPTENSYSILPLRIKGFLPQQAGGAIITNPLVFTLTGSDLDVDKLFFMRPSVKKVSKVSKEMVEALIETFSPFNNITTGTFERVEKFVERALVDTPASLDSIEIEMLDFIDNNPNLLNTSFETISYDNIQTAPQLDNKLARDNALFDSFWSIITSKDYTALAIMPGNFDSLKKSARIANILNDVESKLPTSITTLNKMSIKELDTLVNNIIANPLSPSYLTDVQVRNTVGKNLIAIIANHNSHYAATQGTNLTVSKKYQFQIDNSILNDVSKVEFAGKKISLVICEYLAAIVDNAKDPVLGDIGITPLTINAAMAMARSGFDSTQIGLFMNQPALKRVFLAYNRNSSSYKDINSDIKAEISKYEKARATFDFLAGELKYPNYKFTSNSLYSNIKTSRESENIDIELQKATITQDLSYASFLDSQISVLKAFYKAMTVGDYLSEMISNSKFDTTNGAPSKSFAKVIKTMLRLKRFYRDHTSNEDPPIAGKLLVEPTEGMDESVTKTISESHLPFIQGFYSNTYGMLKKIYGQHFPFFKNYILDSLDELSRNSSRNNLSETEIGEFLDDFITYKVSRLPTLGTEVLEDGTVVTAQDKRKYFINSFPREFITLRRTIPELAQNDFIQKIKAFKADNKIKSPVLLFNNSGGLNQLDRERFTNSWRNMLLSKDSRVKKLALDMFKYAYYKGGLGFSPTSWMHMVPIEVEFAIEGYRDELMRIQSEDSDDMNLFIDQFIMNHSDSHNLLPKASEDLSTLLLNKIIDNSIAFDIESEINSDTSPFDWILAYKSTEVIIPKNIISFISNKKIRSFKVVSQTDESIIYNEINTLGEKNTYKEYSYGDSILNMQSQVGEFTEEDNILNSGELKEASEFDADKFDIVGIIAEAAIVSESENLAISDVPMPLIETVEYSRVQNLEDLAEDPNCPF